MSRRWFLLSATVIGATGIGVLASTGSSAFSLEQGDADDESLYFGHCSVNNQYHVELVAELEARLKGHSKAEIEAALATARCPICGCPIA